MEDSKPQKEDIFLQTFFWFLCPRLIFPVGRVDDMSKDLLAHGQLTEELARLPGIRLVLGGRLRRSRAAS